MLTIDCPACFARFRVPVGVVPPQGRDLRCSSCGHVWHYVDPPASDFTEPDAEPDRLEPAPAPIYEPPPPAAETPPLPESFSDVLRNTALADLPIPPPVLRFGKGPKGPPSLTGRAWIGYGAATAAALFVFWLLGMGQGLVVALVPRMAVIYNLVGATVPAPVPPLVFDQIVLNKKDDEITVAGHIVNQTETQRRVPPVRVVLLEDSEKPPVASWVFQTDKKFAYEKKDVPFSLTRKVDQVDSIHAVRLEFASE